MKKLVFKRIITLALAFVMVVVLLPTTVFSQASGGHTVQNNGLTYDLPSLPTTSNSYILLQKTSSKDVILLIGQDGGYFGSDTGTIWNYNSSYAITNFTSSYVSAFNGTEYGGWASNTVGNSFNLSGYEVVYKSKKMYPVRSGHIFTTLPEGVTWEDKTIISCSNGIYRLYKPANNVGMWVDAGNWNCDFVYRDTLTSVNQNVYQWKYNSFTRTWTSAGTFGRIEGNPGEVFYVSADVFLTNGTVKRVGQHNFYAQGPEANAPISPCIDVTSQFAGKTVTIQSKVSNNFLSAESSRYLYANKTTDGEWEKFYVQDAGNGWVAFMTPRYMYLSVVGHDFSATVLADSSGVGDWQQFKIFQQGDNYYILSKTNARHWTVVSPSTPVQALATQPSTNESFAIEQVDRLVDVTNHWAGKTVTIRSLENGKFLLPYSMGGIAPVYANKDIATSFERFYVESTPNGSVGFLAPNDLYVSALVNNSPIQASSNVLGIHESFRIYQSGQDYYIQSEGNSLYLSTLVGTLDAPVHAQAVQASSWERFDIQEVNNLTLDGSSLSVYITGNDENGLGAVETAYAVKSIFMGINSNTHLDIDPTLQQLTDNFVTVNRKKLEADVVHFSGHGNQNTMFINSNSLVGLRRGSTQGDFYGTNSINWSNTKLVVFAGCETARGSDNIAREAYNRGAECAIGWKETIVMGSLKVWLNIFYIALTDGYTVNESIEYANSYDFYPDPLVKNVGIYGDGSVRIVP